MNGVFVVDKPRGLTSHDVVARVRKAIKSRAVGHAGTLDPMATGVLVVACGEGTKLVPYLTAADKEYETTIALGTTTETLDAEGATKTEAPVPDDWREKLDEALAAERARTDQIPPAYSAIHVDGERAHDLARAGKEVVLAPRPIEVKSFEVLRMEESAVTLRVAAAKGYYVRSLARDLAARLGTVGHLTMLRRTRSGPFAVAEAIALDAPDFSSRALSIEDAAKRSLPSIVLDDAQTIAAGHGKKLVFPIESAAPAVAWLDGDGKLLAIGSIDAEGVGRVVRGFSAAQPR
ncbi:MAG TPA: tRNA pseudouridine(55) synthase TruB [Polyangiaceae bacterium]